MKKYLIFLNSTENMSDAVESDSFNRAKDYAEALLVDQPGGSLAFIYEHCIHAKKGGVTFSRSAPASKLAKVGRIRKRGKAIKGRRHWYEEEIAKLLNLSGEGWTAQDLAQELDRTPSAINHQLNKLRRAELAKSL